jgi:DNA polymerase-3 subunit beta
MKLLILQEKLKQGLSVVEKPPLKSLTLPVLNNILLQAKKNFLILTTTDLETGIRWYSLAKIVKEGEIIIPFSFFSSLLALLPNSQIIIEAKENSLFIECVNIKTTIKGFPANDFPIIPQVPKESFVELDVALLCQGLAQLVDIASVSQTRPEISGIFFSFHRGTLRMAATDSFRLGEKTISFPAHSNQEVSFIVPQKTAKEIIHIFGPKKGRVKLYFSPNQILAESQMEETPHPEIQLVSRLVEGDYPEYQEIIPKKYETQAILSRNEFLNNLKMAALFGGKISEIKLKFVPQKKGVEFFSQSPDLGEHTSFLGGKIKGPPLEISFNHRFLLTGLANIKSSEIVFELSKEEGPAILRPVGDTSYFYVVMPIKSA